MFSARLAVFTSTFSLVLIGSGCGDNEPGRADAEVADTSEIFDSGADTEAEALPPDVGDVPDIGPGDTGGDTLDDVLTDVPDTLQPDTAPAPILDPAEIPQFVMPLVIPSAMPPVSTDAGRARYHIAVRQFAQQMLPPGYPATTVWGYGSVTDPATFHAPSPTIETRMNQDVRVKWVNQLVDDAGHFLPHLLTVDPNLHWANPTGEQPGEEHMRAPYHGPVPIVVHVHGAHVESNSDGNPDAWYLPAAVDLPVGIAATGPRYATVEATEPGSAVFSYPNDKRESTQWFHDHALGITRLNVYTGPAGFWIVRGPIEDALDLPGPAPQLGDAAGTRYYEMPLAIQDRTFRTDGSLFYPDSRAFFDGYDGPFLPDSKVSPIWNPEFFGNTLIVNGHTWPELEVEARLYRFRVLNGSQSRFLLLGLDEESLRFHQIGNEGGFLPDAPFETDTVLLGPAERADVLIDFSGFAPGTEVLLTNSGPDEPFKGFTEPDAPPPADPETTGRVLRFRVVVATDAGNRGTIPTALPAIEPLLTDLPPRDLALFEEMDPLADIPTEALLGTVADGPLDWDAPITERPVKDTNEVWRVANTTGDAHPIHLHLVFFQIIERQPFDVEGLVAAQEEAREHGGEAPDLDDFMLPGARVPDPSEGGWKDTAIAYPGEVVTVIAHFDIAGVYVWHCHILEHEDNEMMRPFEVVEE